MCFIFMFICTLPVLLWSEGVKTSETDDLQQVQKFAVRAGSFAPQKTCIRILWQPLL